MLSADLNKHWRLKTGSQDQDMTYEHHSAEDPPLKLPKAAYNSIFFSLLSLWCAFSTLVGFCKEKKRVKKG